MPDTLNLRPPRQSDHSVLSDICFRAFGGINGQHGFPSDFPELAPASELIAFMLTQPHVFGVVAEIDGRVVGSNFMSEGDTIAGIGPISVDPSCQAKAVGRALMQACLDRAAEQKKAGVRLVQAAFNRISMSLYSKVGFDVREPLSCFQGEPLKRAVPGYPVRPMTNEDIADCDRLCTEVHGHTRTGELHGAIAQGTGAVVEVNGKLTGYTTGIALFSHTVAKSNAELIALISAAEGFAGPGFLLPSRNGEMMRWCLANKLRIVQPMSLMSVGLYNEPRGAFLPSVLF